MTKTAALCVIALCLSAAVLAGADPPKPLNVLVLSGLNNHDWKTTTPALEQIFKECPRFAAVDVIEDPAKMDDALLARYDVIVCNWTPYPETKRIWPEKTEKAFMDFIRKGGGFLVIHAAACSFHEWPEFQQLIGVTWKADKTSHARYHTFKVALADNAHPIARGLSDFYTTDELYQNMVQIDTHPLHPVFKAFSAKDQGGTGKDEPMLLVTQLEKGRGVNLMLGHDAAAMQNAGFQALLLRGTEWAATGEVTIPPPANWPASPPAEKK